MRQSIILPDILQTQFIYEAEKSGLVKPCNNYADDLYDRKDLAAAEMHYKQMLERKTVDKQNLYRMLLLFDDIILSNVTQNYNYEKLTSTGMFSVFFLEDALLSDPIHQDGHIEFAKYLKPAIIPVYKKYIKSYFRLGHAKDGFTSFVSDLYDTILLGKHLPKKHINYIELNKLDFDIRNTNSIKKLKSEFGEVPDILTTNRFLADLSGLLCTLYESLCWQLEISSKKDAAIIDSEFQLANIGCKSLTDDVSNCMEAYNIIRVECEKLIGELPTINSIQEVFRLKEERHHDIHNLKQELSKLEDEIRSGNSIKAIEKAAIDITKASKAEFGRAGETDLARVLGGKSAIAPYISSTPKVFKLSRHSSSS